jgi:nicotinamide mononucleotide transporter
MWRCVSPAYVSILEIIAALLGVANIILIIRRSIWNYPFALAMVALYGFIFYGAKLYSDAGLQVFFFVVNLYGWWSWGRNRVDEGDIVVERLSGFGRLLWIVGSLAAIAIWGMFMAANTDATYPYWDAAIAMLSVAGQILMTRRYIENWHWWIVVNMISVPLYLLKALYLTTGLYALFLVFAVLGLIEWRRAEANQ